MQEICDGEFWILSIAFSVCPAWVEKTSYYDDLNFDYWYSIQINRHGGEVAETAVKSSDDVKLLTGNTNALESIASKGTGKLIDNALDGLNADKIHHILHGSKGTRAGHAWEVLFDGTKPTFEQIRPIIRDVYKNGKITKTLDTTIGTKITNTLKINGHEVWLEYIDKGDKLNIVNSGVNNW